MNLAPSDRETGSRVPLLRNGVAMKSVACLLAWLFLAPQAWATPPPDNPVEDRRAALRQRGAEALKREHARSEADLCAHTRDGSVPAVGNC